jgi:hypothetical protein
MKPVPVTILHADGRTSKQEIEPTVQEFNRLVGGWFEAVHVGDRVLLINEEGLLRGLPRNQHLGRFVGDVVVMDPKHFT